MHIAGSPSQIANALETEHRVVNVERNHGVTVVGIRGCHGNPVGHCTGFVDTFLQDLTVNGFFIEHQLVFVLRGVLLAFRIPNAVLAEHAFHTEGAAFIGYNRHDAATDLLVFQQGSQDAYESHGGGEFALAAGLQLGIEGFQSRNWQGFVVWMACRQVAAQSIAAFAQVLHFRAVFGKAEVRQVAAVDLLVGDLNAEAVAELFERLHVHFLGLVGNVLAFAGLTHAVTFDGFGQDYSWAAVGVVYGFIISSINFVRVVTAAV